MPDLWFRPGREKIAVTWRESALGRLLKNPLKWQVLWTGKAVA
jgi:hypothetical protein